MNASKLFAFAATLAFAGSAVASDITVANAAISAAAASQLTLTAQRLNIPTVLVDKSAGRSRAEVRAEAVESVQTQRATDAGNTDWFMK
jgi:hypothetical protein